MVLSFDQQLTISYTSILIGFVWGVDGLTGTGISIQTVSDENLCSYLYDFDSQQGRRKDFHKLHIGTEFDCNT